MKKRVLIGFIMVALFAGGIFAGYKVNDKMGEATTAPTSSQTETEPVSTTQSTTQTTETTTEKPSIRVEENEIVLDSTVVEDYIQKADKVIKNYTGKSEGEDEGTIEEIYEHFEDANEFACELAKQTSSLVLKVDGDTENRYGGFVPYKKTEDFCVDEIAEEFFSILVDDKACSILSGNIFETDEYVFLRYENKAEGTYYDNLGVDPDGDKFVLTYDVTTIDTSSGMIKNTRKASVDAVQEDGAWVFTDIAALPSSSGYYNGLR